MKKYLWLGLTFLSISWLFIIPIFATPDLIKFFIFFSAGILFNILSFNEEEINLFNKTNIFNKKYLLFLIPVIISIFIIPFPYSIGPILLVFSIVSLLSLIYFKRFKKQIARLSLGIGISGLILTVQAFFYPVYVIISLHINRLDILSNFVSSLCNLFGLNTSVNNGIIFVQSAQQIYPITTTLDKLGFFPWFNIFIGVLFLFVLFFKTKKSFMYLGIFFLLSFFYIILRYILTIFIFSETYDLNIFLDLSIISISFVTFGLLFMKFFPVKTIHFDFISFNNFRFNKKTALSLFLIFIFIFSLVGTFVFQDPGYEKNGRILIDEYHSAWSPANKPMDKEWYGEDSVYNYYSWAQWLNNYYHVTINEDELLTSDLIDNYDILILKCPTSRYSNKEINDIVNFVYNGGGLLLIGDHTNLFGMSENLNQISSNFGITFNMDSTYDIETRGLSIYNHFDFLSHPVVKNVEKISFLTSCTLDAPIGSENIIIGNKLIAEPGTYSTKKFFRENIELPDISYGLLLQSASVKYGSGRVLAFTDSTIFSNFCIFMEDYTIFSLGIMEYLNRENTYSYINWVLFLISIISLVFLFKILRKEKKIFALFLIICIGLFSFSASSIIFSGINEINYSLPEAHSEYTRICFEKEHSNFMTTIEPYPQTYDLSNYFNIFYVWTQRMGYVPRLEKTLDDSAMTCDVIVIINTEKSFTEDKLSFIVSYVNDGGNLLILDSFDNTFSTSNEILGSFDMQINFNLQKDINNLSETIFQGENISVLNYSNNVSYIQIAVKNQGMGKVIVVLDSYIFSDESMGPRDNRFVVPNNNQRWIYEKQYLIFEELIFEQ
jgi:hypothetical protein